MLKLKFSLCTLCVLTAIFSVIIFPSTIVESRKVVIDVTISHTDWSRIRGTTNNDIFGHLYFRREPVEKWFTFWEKDEPRVDHDAIGGRGRRRSQRRNLNEKHVAIEIDEHSNAWAVFEQKRRALQPEGERTPSSPPWEMVLKVAAVHEAYFECANLFARLDQLKFSESGVEIRVHELIDCSHFDIGRLRNG